VLRSPLRSPSFRLLFAARSVSGLGDRIVPVALAFAVLQQTGSVGDLGLVMAAQTIPLVAFVLLGGVWADRLPRRRVMIGSDLVRLAAQGCSAALLISGTAPIAALAALQAVYGMAAAFFGPAADAVVAQTVPARDLQPANALIGLGRNLTLVLGPALAGVLVATVGPGWGLAVDAATFLASAACLVPLRVDERRLSARTSTFAELRAGWRGFRERRWLLVTVLVFTLYIGFSFAPFEVLGPQMARVSLGGVGAWAAINVALGVGSLIGGVLGLRLVPRHPLRLTMAVFVATTPALIALVAARAPLPLIVAVAVADGSSGALFNVFWYTALQSEVPPHELSRVISWDYLGGLAMQPVGELLSGPAASALSISGALYGAAAIALILFGSALLVPAVRNFRFAPVSTHVEENDAVTQR
jgi:predicted MFS family arabinose efflux permease